VKIARRQAASTRSRRFGRKTSNQSQRPLRRLYRHPRKRRQRCRLPRDPSRQRRLKRPVPSANWPRATLMLALWRAPLLFPRPSHKLAPSLRLGRLLKSGLTFRQTSRVRCNQQSGPNRATPPRSRLALRAPGRDGFRGSGNSLLASERSIQRWLRRSKRSC